jgi:hypothetical protein
MLKLLENFTVEQTIFFLIVLALAIKGILDFYDWLRKKNREKFDADYEKIKDHDAIVAKQEDLEQHYQELNNSYSELSGEFLGFSSVVNDDLKIIKKSMMHDIKQWIIQQHKKHMDKGWVAIEDLNMLEYRFADYQALGGNGTIPSLMDELRALPKYPKDRLE